ncbi:hypothetical protein B0H15DRAFT_804139 [Mycena belliarum]|uniref:Uncharacterized protein n=1 Tax=Mycena belliarum TaxID=1033014 RepID=A0AAD6TUJ1_9AGAR|nr:hypothetical protein B0H15DRAFT_804139 [Mycena belliae]
MPPTRNQRSLRRLSSPLCPPYVLPPSARLIEEEEEDRARMNKEVCALMAAASGAPEGSTEVLEAEHAMDDYEELYGTFIADAENDAWHVRKSEAYGKLLELRARAAECSFNDRVHELEDYFAAVDAYKTEFDTSFDVEDEWTDSLQLQKLLIRAYHELMLRSNGDLQKASLLAGRRVIPDVVNPFPAGDPRRAELDTKLRQLHAYYHLKEAAPRFQTLHRRRFTFQLPNTYKDQPECELRRRLEYWCHLQIWATDVEGLIDDARDRAHLPADAIHSMPPVIFVGKGAAIFNFSLCPRLLCVAQRRYKGRRFWTRCAFDHSVAGACPFKHLQRSKKHLQRLEPLPSNGLTSEEGYEETWRRYRDWTPPMWMPPRYSMMVSPRPSNGFTSEEGCEENWRRYRDSTTPMDSMLVSGFIVGDPNYPAWRVNPESAGYKALRRAARTVAREAGETFGMLDVVRLRSGESHNSLF